MKAPEIFDVFVSGYLKPRAKFDLGEVHFRQENGITAEVEILCEGMRATIASSGNGRLDAVSNAIKKYFAIDYTLTGYEQHALSSGSFAQAVSFVGVETDGGVFWGAGENSDIIRASVSALVSAVNNYFAGLK